MAGTEQGQDRDKTGTRLGRGRAKEGKKGVKGGEVREWSGTGKFTR